MRESAEFDVKDFDDPNNNKGVYARFYWTSVQDHRASSEEGRPIFKDCEFVEIIAAGNANNIIRRPARDMDRDRFHREYAMFKAGDAEQMVGTPLAEVPWITRSQVEELVYRKIRTLEELANISDHACSVPGMLELRRKAQAWMKKAEEAKPFTAMQAELDALKAQLAAMKASQADEAKAKTPAPAGKG